jgi:hypothetical protein
MKAKPEKPIKVRIQHGCVTSAGRFSPGKSIELPAVEARYLIALKKAAPVGAAAKKETATKVAGENTSAK